MISFERYALRYLDQWFLQERPFFEGLRTGDPEERRLALVDAATYFGVAMNFPLRYDVQRGLRRLEPAADAIVQAHEPAACAVESVEALAELLAERYGGKKLVSAASKLLWLKHRDGFVIYDRNARQALGFSGERYRDYFAEWSEQYSNHERAIHDACARLPSVRDFALCGAQVPLDQITEAIDARWFQERVFDTYLWFQGG